MAIAYDNTSFGQIINTTLTVSHTCTGSDLILFVAANYDDYVGNHLDSITYNGVAMTLAVSKKDATGLTASLYYLVNPATGANNVVITTDGSRGQCATAISYTGVAQTSPINVTGTGTDVNDTSYNQALTSTVDNCWAIYNNRAGSGLTLTASAGSTVRQQPETIYFGGGIIVDSGGPITPAGEKTLGVTSGSQFFSGAAMLTFKPAEDESTFIPTITIF